MSDATKSKAYLIWGENAVALTAIGLSAFGITGLIKQSANAHREYAQGPVASACLEPGNSARVRTLCTNVLQLPVAAPK